VLRGSYYKQGNSLRFEPQIIDSRSGNLVETVRPVVVPAGAPSAAVDSIRQRVLAVFAVLADTFFDAWPVASHPATYDAYLEFAAARHSGTELDHGQADEHLARANLLDSSFTMPLVQLSWDRGCAFTDSIVKHLGPPLARLPVFDRAGLTRNQARCHGWRDLEYKAAREVYAAAPKSDRAAVLFAFTARHNNHIGEAVAAMERLDSVRHRFDRMYWGNRVISYHLLGKYDAELATVHGALGYLHDDWQFMAMKGRALAALGRVDELLPLLDSMKSVPFYTDQVGTPTGWMRHIARELRVHKHPNEARVVSDSVLAWFRLRPHPTDPEMQEELARAFYEAGRWVEARDETRRVLRADTTNMAVRVLLGAIAARQGDRRTVDRADAWLATLKGPYLHGNNTFERARLAAILGERVRANALLMQALDEGFAVSESVGPHDDPDFDSIRDLPAFGLLYRDKS
jgi:tetratricopeptide (TPR) repeat protein